MNLVRFISFLGFLLILSSKTYAQETLLDRQHPKSTQQFGAAFGGMSGHGLAYRITHRKTIIQVTYAPFFAKDLAESTLGFSVMYKIAQHKKSNLFLYSGQRFVSNNYYCNKNLFRFFEVEPAENITWNVGFGAGIELIVLQNISLNFMGGFCSYNELESIKPVLECGVFYIL